MIDLRVGDCREHLRTMADESVHCVVTSPPYYGLRDYGVAGQLGLEPTPEEYVARLVEVFREARRVLRDDGTLWLNLGDSYAAQRGGTHQPAETLAGGNGGYTDDGDRVNRGRLDGYNPSRNASAIGLKHKDLIGIPWRVAFALRADGWYLRQDIIWHKPNPMPESVRDRCTKSHEYLFLFSKRERYYFDQEAILEPVSLGTQLRMGQDIENQSGSLRAHAGAKSNGPMKAVGRKISAGRHQGTRGDADPRYRQRKAPRFGGSKYGDDARPESRTKSGNKWSGAELRNKRSVWTISTAAFKEAHFATFPPALVEPCILAGCALGGVVLDPFAGAGTVGLVAQRLQRDALLIELNPDYARMAYTLIYDDAPLLAEFAPRNGDHA